jgi:cytosine/adenosine deaminase-related metal-dependent hydrolase
VIGVVPESSRHGRCPVPELLYAGVNVALGSDGNAPNRTFNLFEDMRTAMIKQRTHFGDISYLPPGKVIEMATINAAKAIGETNIGTLKKGLKADVIIIDLFKPHLVPIMMIPYRIAYCCSGYDVKSSIIDGELVMENRKMIKVDENEILEEAERVASDLFSKEEIKKLTKLPDSLWNITY